MPQQPDFGYLADHFGEIVAWHCLAEIEKAAGIQPRHFVTDPEVRLTHAYRLQDMRAAAAIHSEQQIAA